MSIDYIILTVFDNNKLFVRDHIKIYIFDLING